LPIQTTEDDLKELDIRQSYLGPLLKFLLNNIHSVEGKEQCKLHWEHQPEERILRTDLNRTLMALFQLSSTINTDIQKGLSKSNQANTLMKNISSWMTCFV
jgi:hypothetical protein